MLKSDILVPILWLLVLNVLSRLMKLPRSAFSLMWHYVRNATNSSVKCSKNKGRIQDESPWSNPDSSLCEYKQDDAEMSAHVLPKENIETDPRI
jgi:hypothetical protein